MPKLKPAREVMKERGPGDLWLNHAEITPDDLTWLVSAERLTLWNVRVPTGLLAQLPALWWLDLRGGSATDLSWIGDCANLRYLQVNQVRGLCDLTLLSTFKPLQLLSLYGLSKVVEVPSLQGLAQLRRLEIGQMRALPTLGALLDAPNLKELAIIKRVGITERDVARINGHPSLEQFVWATDDVPSRISDPIIASIRLPCARIIDATEWFSSLAP